MVLFSTLSAKHHHSVWQPPSPCLHPHCRLRRLLLLLLLSGDESPEFGSGATRNPRAKDHITPAGPPPRSASERRRGQMFKRVGRGRGAPDLCSRLPTSNAGSHGRERRADLCGGVASSAVRFFSRLARAFALRRVFVRSSVYLFAC